MPGTSSPGSAVWIVRVLAATAAGVVLAVGVAVDLVGRQDVLAPLLAIACAAGLAALSRTPTLERRLRPVFDLLARPSPRARAAIAWVVFVVAMGYLFLTAVQQHRDLVPKWHDEHAYLLQARMLSGGRLWMPAHPLADFLDSFYILVEPVYASAYFPGTALLHAPALWLGLPTWVTPLLIAGACVGLAYRLIVEVLGGTAGLLAVVAILASKWFRMLGIMVMSHPAALLLGLLMLWTHVRWLDSRRAGWMVMTGAMAGWLAITRPLDALCYAMPVLVSTALAAWPRSARRWRPLARVGLQFVVPLIPFLAMQIVFNLGTTGRWNRTPNQLYFDRDMPGMGVMRGAADAARRPRSVVAQKQAMYDTFTAPAVRYARGWANATTVLGDRAAELGASALPAAWFVAVLAPLGALTLATARRWLVLAPALLMLPVYWAYPFFLPHYGVAVMASVVLLLVGAAHLAAGLGPAVVRRAVWLMVLGLVLLEYPQFHPRARDELHAAPGAALANRDFDGAVRGPALVFVRYRPGNSTDDEPVYNIAAAWPDDCDIVRLHDLGERNIEAIRYFARSQPARRVYLFDRTTRSVSYLATAGELAARPVP